MYRFYCTNLPSSEAEDTKFMNDSQSPASQMSHQQFHLHCRFRSRFRVLRLVDLTSFLFWQHVSLNACLDDRCAWIACRTRGIRISSRLCVCGDAAATRPISWTTSRRKASYTRRVARLCANADELWDERSCHRLYRNPECDKYAVAFWRAR